METLKYSLGYTFVYLKVIIRDYNQSQPRCIPQQIFKVMLLCLERRVDKRISLEDLEQKLAAVTLDLLSCMYCFLVSQQTKQKRH